MSTNNKHKTNKPINMKKSYITPNIRVIEIEERDIICSSPDSSPVGGTTPIFGAREDRSSLWGDEE